MGVYLNPGARMLRMNRRNRIYVDKSMLIASLNTVINTEQRFVCVSRPRCFGKTTSVNMVCAYYDRTVDAASEFAELSIVSDPSFDVERNKYDVIRFSASEFWCLTHDIDSMLDAIQKSIIHDLLLEYPDACDSGRYPGDLPFVLDVIHARLGRSFVIAIDGWDCVMRTAPDDHDGHLRYLRFLNSLLKDKTYVALCYMTGVLPIKKAGNHSCLNKFEECSMVAPHELGPFMGFTESEVAALCAEWSRSPVDCRDWYGGYLLRGAGEVYSPRPVVRFMATGRLDCYWARTEALEALKHYIDMNIDGLHDKVIELMGGARVEVDTRTYGNDMATFNRADDVLTLLIHLGYLAWDADKGEVFIPNCEIMGEYASATSGSGWHTASPSVTVA